MPDTRGVPRTKLTPTQKARGTQDTIDCDAELAAKLEVLALCYQLMQSNKELKDKLQKKSEACGALMQEVAEGAIPFYAFAH